MAYDLAATEQFIDGLNLSREAQHLLNECLWRGDLSPSALLKMTDRDRIVLVYRVRKAIRPEARTFAVMLEMWNAFAARFWSGYLKTAIDAAGLRDNALTAHV